MSQMPGTIKVSARLAGPGGWGCDMVEIWRKESHEARVSEEVLSVGRDPSISRAWWIVLVTSTWEGTSNIMTMGWHMMLGFSPALFGCYIWEENYSYQMLRRSEGIPMRSMMLTTHLQHITLGIQAAVSSSATSSGVSERLDAATFCSRWATRNCTGDGQDDRASLQEPCERYLSRRGAARLRDAVDKTTGSGQLAGLEWKPRNEADVVGVAIRQHSSLPRSTRL